MRCGSTGRSGPTSGCCTTRRARRRRPHAACRQATRRRSLLFSGVTIGLVVTAVLGTLFVLQRNEAARQQAITSARRLAATAERQRDAELEYTTDTPRADLSNRRAGRDPGAGDAHARHQGRDERRNLDDRPSGLEVMVKLPDATVAAGNGSEARADR